jgi:hypothetical protein
MNVQAVIAADLIIAALSLFVIILLSRGKLYVGYAVIWLMGLLGAAVLATVEPLRLLFTTLVGALFPVSALTMLAFGFVFLLLIYFSVQVTLLGDRVTQLAQHIAILELEREETARRATPQSETPQAG